MQCSEEKAINIILWGGLELYCKYCGKQLSSDSRFCDRCGKAIKTENTALKRTSTSPATRTGRTSSSYSRNIEQRSTASKTREYQNNRRREIEERKRKQKNNRIIAFLLLFAVVIAAVLGFAAYNAMKPGTEDAAVTQSPLPTKEVMPDEELNNLNESTELYQENDEEETKTENKDKTSSSQTEDEEVKLTMDDFETTAEKCKIYRDDRMRNIRCPYPSSFEQGSRSNSSTVISLVDTINDGAMMICTQDVNINSTGSSLMKDYASGVGGEIKSSRAGDNWYSITFERNNKVNHRKAVVYDGLCVYYDFSYDVDSSSKSNYEEYMSYFDFYLDSEIEKFTSKNKGSSADKE